MAVNIVKEIDDSIPINNVLVTVFNKSGLDSFIPGLIEINSGITIYSTGGTYQVIRKILGEGKGKKNLILISDYTGQPEMQGGLVKTLDYKIYLGLLSETYNENHKQDLMRTNAVKFDMVVVNLYPFALTIASSDASPEQARADIDIGGPCMIRSAAKNFLRVASVTDPADYDKILSQLRKNSGKLSLKTRLELAKTAFAHTATYDSTIADYLASCSFEKVKSSYTVVK